MQMNEKRESAQIIQFPLNRRFDPLREDKASSMDPRVIAALDPAWYHLEAMDGPAPKTPPRH